MMKKGIIWLLLQVFVLFLSITVVAQDNHFIYLQSDNGQPFYVKLNKKLFSSSTAGYIILPKLTNGDYSLTIGFPKNEQPEEEFQLKVDGKNQGFLLKELQNNLTLLNLETMALIAGTRQAQPVPDTVATRAEVVQSDPFSSLLAEVVKDSSILKSGTVVSSTVVTEKPLDTAKKENENKVAEGYVVASADSAMAKVDSTGTGSRVSLAKTDEEMKVQKEMPSSDSVNQKVYTIDSLSSASELNSISTKGSFTEKENGKDTTSGKEILGNSNDSLLTTQGHIVAIDSLKSVLSPFKRILLVNEKGGKDMVYVNDKTNDTIRLFMPVTDFSAPQISGEKARDSIIFTPEHEADTNLTITPTIVVPAAREAEKDTLVVLNESKKEKRGDTVKQARIIYNPDGDSSKEKQSAAKGEGTKKQAIANTDCASRASERDFLRLRKRMAGESDNLKMIEVARRFFKLNCYTTEQVRNLSYLFMDDEGKYQFFDLAYPFTSDSDQFYTLESQLKDTYYIKRFKAMLHK